jgi:branched-chain amino acid transport system ATP-binding protein
MTNTLTITDLNAHYGSSHVLQGVDLSVRSDEVLALFGRNGMGKTTLVHTIVGMVAASSGSVTFDGNELVGAPPHRASRLGIGLVPQGRRVFGPLSVEENLEVGSVRANKGDWTLERVYDLMPRLAERRRQRAGSLSGGEQQMLAIGRALIGNPRLLILDEPSEGLAPIIVEQVGTVIGDLRAAGIGVLLVEQNLGMALAQADRVAIMVKGRIAWEDTTEVFRGSRQLAHELLGVT